MPDLHAIPGIWTPIKGYDGLLRRLRSLQKSGKIGEVLATVQPVQRHTARLNCLP